MRHTIVAILVLASAAGCALDDATTDLGALGGDGKADGARRISVPLQVAAGEGQEFALTVGGPFLITTQYSQDAELVIAVSGGGLSVTAPRTLRVDAPSTAETAYALTLTNAGTVAISGTLMLEQAAPIPAAVRDLLDRGSCNGCHAIDKKIIGPAFNDVARRYRTMANASDHLVEKVANGSTGVWGPIPMPPNVNISRRDTRTLVNWILTLNP